jgi:hypothetical protein
VRHGPGLTWNVVGLENALVKKEKEWALDSQRAALGVVVDVHSIWVCLLFTEGGNEKRERSGRRNAREEGSNTDPISSLCDDIVERT